MTAHGRRLLQIFVTGLLAALPLAATILLFVWAARTIFDLVGPYSFFGRALRALGFGVTGSEIVGYLIGVGVIVLGIFGLGLVIQTRLRHVLAGAVNAVIQRVPLVRNVYDLFNKFVDLISKRDQEGMRSMSAVWLRFGGGHGAAVLGLLSTTQPVLVGGERYLGVLVPTAPVPVGGGLIYVPESWVSPADVGVEGLTSIYVSMGVTSGQHLPPAPPAPVPATVPGETTAVTPRAPGPPAAS